MFKRYLDGYFENKMDLILKRINSLSDELNSIKNDLIRQNEDLEFMKKNLSNAIFDQRNINVLTAKETIDRLLKDENLSIARFGDGEIRLMLFPDFSIGFQKNSNELNERLKEVFLSTSDKCLTCLSGNYKYGVKKNDFWINVIEKTKFEISKLIPNNKTFGNAGITRNANNIPEMKKVWKGKDIVLVEGKLSRLGVGNDLFSDVNSIKRILCPARNAYDKYDDILKECLKYEKDKLILIALGPTATVLAYDLSNNGYRALDIGHIDIVYEWKLRGAKEKITIPGKFVNEVKGGGTNIEDCTDSIYLESIVSEIL